MRRWEPRRAEPGRARGLRHAFTLVEVVIAAVLFLVLGGIAFQMFTKGSKAGAKATWRTQITGRTRAAIRQIKQVMEASSYPSMVSLTNYDETTAGFEFLFSSSGASAAAAGLTTYTYDVAGEVASWHRCHPLDLTPMSGGVLNGLVAKHTLRLEDSAMYPGKRLDLMMDTTTTTVDASMALGSFGPAETRRLATEIESIELSVPTSMIGVPNAVVYLRLKTRDPIDGYMRLVEQARANINVAPIVGP